MSRPPRVIMAKVGLDGHDRGAKAVAYALRDAGMEVIYTGLRATPESVVETAIQEDVDILGISLLSGAHVEIAERVLGLLDRQGADDIKVVIGGNLPGRDHQQLRRMGVAGIFPTGSTFDEVITWIRATCAASADQEVSNG